MFKGFYGLTSGMLTQNRNLNVISNNMVNVLTPGYKKDTYLSGTFKDEMFVRSGNKDREDQTQIGSTSMIRASYGTAVDFSQGSFKETGSNLDVALVDKGFFQIQTQNGTVYTRNGSFMIDDGGYLALSGVGRVMGAGGPIYMPTTSISINDSGEIYSNDGTMIDKIRVVDFADYDQLTKTDQNLFTSTAPAMNSNTGMVWKSLESSNAEPVDQMTAMMTSQRNLQSAAQVLKMYDQLMGKVTTEIGKV